MNSFGEYVRFREEQQATAAYRPAGRPAQPANNTQAMMKRFVADLVPNLVTPQSARMTPEALEGVVAAFRAELQGQVQNYNPHNNLATSLNDLFRAANPGKRRA
jgi:hypothetical protein